jgi:site-specific DNA recombinase
VEHRRRPYGYLAQRIQHPVPFKAAQGRTKSRLILDPARATVVAQIFIWRVVDKLGMPAIAARLNADLVSCPAPGSAAGWTAQAVHGLLRNPKYTGHMVFGRLRTRNGHRTPVPPDQWLWSPEPVHPAIVDRQTWDEAQNIAAGHATSRDGDEPNTHPATLRTYTYRSRVRCRDRQRRMTGRTNGRHGEFTYYRCPHDPANPRHVAAQPDHPRTVQVPETSLDKAAGIFFATRIFGPDRARLLAEQLPATDADATERRHTQAAALNARIRQIDIAQDSKILELEQLPADPADTASAAMRTRIRARFAELHHEREHVEAQLKTLDKTAPAAADPALLDQLPLAGDILPGLPPALKARLFAAFDVEVLWNKEGRQATVFVEITENTLRAVPGILDPGQDGYHDTSSAASTDTPAAVGHLISTPRDCPMAHRRGQRPASAACLMAARVTGMPRRAASVRSAIWASASSPYRSWNLVMPPGRNSHDSVTCVPPSTGVNV